MTLRSSILAALLATLSTVAVVQATLSPSYPEPGTAWTTGKEYSILWEEDNVPPTISAGWKNFRIDLMTGDNMDQILLANVAKNVTGNGPMSFKYVAPAVSPPSPIYFLMFTNDAGENAWTTRFSIVGEDNKQIPPEKSAQPNGEKVPWGVGKMVGGGSKLDAAANTSPSSLTASASSSVSESSSGPIASIAATSSSSSHTQTPKNASAVALAPSIMLGCTALLVAWVAHF